jgi:hypothetical protein
MKENKWLAHVMKCKKKYPKKKYSEILVIARRTYTKPKGER